MEIDRSYTAKGYAARRRKTLYIVIHYTGNKKDSAKANAQYFAREKKLAGAHFFVDATGVYASTPEANTAFSVGKLYNSKHAPLWRKCMNSNSLNIEIACDAGGYTSTQGAINNAIELTKIKMREYGIPASHVVRHYDVCGKDCPGYWLDDGKWEREFHGRLSGSAPAQAPQATASRPRYTYSQRVKDYQQAYNTSYGGDGKLAEDGLNGPATKASFNNVMIKYRRPYDGHHAMVKFIQRTVGAKADGYYGQDTKDKVIEWQRSHGLTADGIVGPATISAMVA